MSLQSKKSGHRGPYQGTTAARGIVAGGVGRRSSTSAPIAGDTRLARIAPDHHPPLDKVDHLRGGDAASRDLLYPLALAEKGFDRSRLRGGPRLGDDWDTAPAEISQASHDLRDRQPESVRDVLPVETSQS